MNKQLDFSAAEERARAMSGSQLAWALSDILATLESADSLDRADGGNRGGYYRDEASVIRAEMKRRGGGMS